MRLINFEDILDFCPNVFGILKISSCLKTFGQFEKKLLNNFGQIMKVKKLLLSLPTIPRALS
jgi:hypothetical protein